MSRAFLFYVYVILLLIPSMSWSEADVRGDYVVILHGIARSSAHMEDLQKYLEKQGYDVVNLDYPSTDYELDELVDRIHHDLILSTLTENKPIHFVGYSMGGLLVRGLLNKYRPENLGKVVQLASPNHGSEVADFLQNNVVYQMIYGPAGQQLTTHNDQTKAWLGKPNYELGVIAGNRTIDPISSIIIPGDDDGKVSIESTKLGGMTDHIIVDASHTFFPSHDDVVKQTAYFLKHGVFDK